MKTDSVSKIRLIAVKRSLGFGTGTVLLVDVFVEKPLECLSALVTSILALLSRRPPNFGSAYRDPILLGLGATIFGGVALVLLYLTHTGSLDTAPPTATTSAALPEQRPEPNSVSRAAFDQQTNDVNRTAHVVDIALAKGSTLLGTLSEIGVPKSQALDAATSLATLFDPKLLRAGQKIRITLTGRPDDENGSLLSLAIVYKTDRLIIVRREDDGRYASRKAPMKHTTQLRFASGKIEGSFHQSARALDVPSSVLMQVYPTLSHGVDFQRDIRNGNRFSIAFEEYDDGEILGPHAGAFVFVNLELDDKTLSLLRFTTEDGYTGYFDSEGNSVETSLRKTPVDGARLASRFGKRAHPILGYSRMHKGLDFAAPHGSPVYAAGNGLVVERGLKGTFGNHVRIRHAAGVETTYSHLSSYAGKLKLGARVRQGELVGFVGSTGLATGPNLHYEVLINGNQVNPISLETPPSRTLASDDLESLRLEISDLRQKIGSI